MFVHLGFDTSAYCYRKSGSVATVLLEKFNPVIQWDAPVANQRQMHRLVLNLLLLLNSVNVCCLEEMQKTNSLSKPA